MIFISKIIFSNHELNNCALIHRGFQEFCKEKSQKTEAFSSIVFGNSELLLALNVSGRDIENETCFILFISPYLPPGAIN